MENMNSRSSFYDIKSFYNKNAKLKASYKGMRYQVEQTVAGQEDGNAGKKLKAYVWPEPFCFEKTPDQYKQTMEFEYSEKGLDAAYKWICGCYLDNQEKWEHARKFPLESAGNMGLV